VKVDTEIDHTHAYKFCIKHWFCVCIISFRNDDTCHEFSREQRNQVLGIITAACRAVSRQGLGKHVPASTNTHSNITGLLETMFSTSSVQRGYKEEIWSLPCGSGVEYLHRSPESRRNPVLEGIIGPPSSWGYKYEDLALQVWGSFESETVKYDHESRGTRTIEWLRWRSPAAIVNDRPILSSERMLHKDYDRKGSVEKINGRGSQGAWRWDKLMGGKSPVIK
jgi:hypothetical protein